MTAVDAKDQPSKERLQDVSDAQILQKGLKAKDVKVESKSREVIFGNKSDELSLSKSNVVCGTCLVAAREAQTSNTIVLPR